MDEDDKDQHHSRKKSKFDLSEFFLMEHIVIC